MIHDASQIPADKIPTKVYAFGGLDEIGKNMYGIEHDNELLVIDCGIKFADEEHLGVNGIIANFARLKEVAHKLKAVVITHGHEDHIGGVPYLVKAVKVPVIYAPKMAAELILRKLALDHRDVKPPKIVAYDDLSSFATDHFAVDFYRVNHSIPDAFGVCVKTPNGIIVESGDYRFDFGSRGEEVDLRKIAEISARGVSLFMCETTNAEVPGFSPSEHGIYRNIRKIITEAKGRVIMTTFASNITRINEVVEIALNLKRKICLLGKSMDANVSTSRKIGYININDDDLIAARDLKHYKDEEIMIFCTGSQGEDLAALNAMARDRHTWVTLKPTDTVIMSSNPIPGNYASVEDLLNELSKHGVTIFENSPSMRLHASGHATRQELQLMLRLLRPQYLMPIHGEYKMFRTIRKIAAETGLDEKNVVVAKNGEVLYLIDQQLYYSDETFDAQPVFIEGRVAVNNSAVVHKERKVLSEDGIFVVIIALDKIQRDVSSLPVMVTRGCFFAKESAPLMAKMSHTVRQAVRDELAKQPADQPIAEEPLKRAAIGVISQFVWRNKRRNPLLSAIIQQI